MQLRDEIESLGLGPAIHPHVTNQAIRIAKILRVARCVCAHEQIDASGENVIAVAQLLIDDMKAPG